MLGVTVSGGGVSTPYTSWFMFILCEFFAVPGREGPGGARAGGEESIMPGNRNSQNKKRRGQRNVELKEVRKLEERQGRDARGGYHSASADVGLARGTLW